MCLLQMGYEYRIVCTLTTEQTKSILTSAPHFDICDELGRYEYRNSCSLTSMPDAEAQRAEYGLYFCGYTRSRTSLEVLGYVLSRCADLGPVALHVAN